MAKSLSLPSRPLNPLPVCSSRFSFPKVRCDSAPDFPIIRIELSSELALESGNLPVLKEIEITNKSCRDDSYWLSEDVIRVDSFFSCGPWAIIAADFTPSTMMVLRIAVT